MRLDIDVCLFKDLQIQSLKDGLPIEQIIQNYIRIGLKEVNEDDNMHSVNVSNDIMEKINNRCKELNCNPEKLIHSILFDYLKKVESVPSTADYENDCNS